MTLQKILIRFGFIFLLSAVWTECLIHNEKHSVRKFPEDFIFGATTASYQIEGAWNEDAHTSTDDMGVIEYQPSHWQGGESSWHKVVPDGFYGILKTIKEDSDNPPVMITENGFSTLSGLGDDGRIDYYRKYLNAMLDAIDEGCNVMGYTAWSLMDNFEWKDGLRVRFGLYEVDYESPERTSTPRKSAFVYKEIVRTRSLDFDYEPDTTFMTIDEGH